MDPQTRRRHGAGLWALAGAQHGVVSRAQLLAAGLSSDAIKHRRRSGRLHHKARGVYAVGRPELSRLGEMMVAVLALGPGAVVSHATAAELWGVRRSVACLLEISLPTSSGRRRPGVAVHHRRGLAGAVTSHRGVLRLRGLLDEQTFRLTDSRACFCAWFAERNSPYRPPSASPAAGAWTSSGPSLVWWSRPTAFAYHRTPSQQNRDYRRDHAHRLNGLTPLRFTHFQVSRQADYVVRV